MDRNWNRAVAGLSLSPHCQRQKPFAVLGGRRVLFWYLCHCRCDAHVPQSSLLWAVEEAVRQTGPPSGNTKGARPGPRKITTALKNGGGKGGEISYKGRRSCGRPQKTAPTKGRGVFVEASRKSQRAVLAALRRRRRTRPASGTMPVPKSARLPGSGAPAAGARYEPPPCTLAKWFDTSATDNARP